MTENTEKKEINFLPFHAINEFMLDEYRLHIIQETLYGLSSLPPNLRKPLDQFTNRFIKISGFRNPVKAPVNLKINPFIEAFKKQPKLVAATLAAWANIHSELQNQIFQLLQSRQWELLPIDADRTVLPGFLIIWPAEENFETIYQAYQNQFPLSKVSIDDVSLMSVWLSGRLPYKSSETAEKSNS